MYSSRMFAALALVAAVAAYPADDPFIPRPITTLTEADFDDGPSWWSFPSLDTFFAPLWKLFPSFADIGPRIEYDENRFRVIVNVKNYKKDDLKVIITSDFINIEGSHETKDSDHDHFASKFFHTYSLPINASAADASALLYSNGFLEVVVPLKGDGDKARPEKVEVPITETEEPFLRGVPQSTDKPETLETVAPEAPEAPEIPETANTDKAEATTNVPTTIDDDTREPTTSSDREYVTEKDNSIPHGDASEANELNEVQP